ncbi:hypothetical protein CROQUDRAFT_54535 [Cronartium quercuum f. sp. fusiforme G11]|uniref:Pescadillo homolog n=1 Tax=Cronartium quercuum f. sp. fusiforme G11 TaxID=708437 RepID=A0A9P6N688_9BASI|nr:hypothetical protein CROQUDRAFT_54535 [Cronartium quercuum f. sp. fusiforme G11]
MARSISSQATARPKPSLKKKKGTSGAAKNYVTRNQALKKLQCTLSDFRRLCILKGIYPREPRNRKKANKGSTAPASFYYAKDIAYLLHEPVLDKLREHKAFAKKLSRALGRGQDGLAKNIEENHEGYRIDHIIKERYPVFGDSIRDLDDALSLIILFSNLPANTQVSPKVIANCARLAAEWQIYVMRTKSLRKVFLSIKGIYYQAEVEGQHVTWLVPYAFTQRVPTDVDFRIMLTFLELYQTLLGFVFYRLFQSINLIYPPKLDFEKDEAGAGLGALLLEQSTQKLLAAQSSDPQPQRTVKDVRHQIKELVKKPLADVPDEDPSAGPSDSPANADEDQDMGESPPLFSTYVFFLSREVTRSMLEFVVRSFGGEVGWDPVLGAGSAFTEEDSRITHHIIDRPTLPEALTQFESQRAFVQPQWVVDCVNHNSLLPTGPYAPGKILPPHLSPFVDHEDLRKQGGYIPEGAETVPEADVDKEMEDGDDDEDDEDDGEMEVEEEENVAASQKPSKKTIDSETRPALFAAARDPTDSTLVHAAEIEAEELGISHGQFESELKKAKASSQKSISGRNKKVAVDEDDGREMNEAMLTGKQKKLYQKMTYTKHKRAEERNKLEAKKRALISGGGGTKQKEKERTKSTKKKV